MENQELSESEDSDDENTLIDHSIEQQNEAEEVLAGSQKLQEGMNCYYKDRNTEYKWVKIQRVNPGNNPSSNY
jgi:hypothetical protein